MAEKSIFFVILGIFFPPIDAVLLNFVTFAAEISKIEPHYGRLFWNRIYDQLYC